jgi:4'-phosphopantetheinyl transferase
MRDVEVVCVELEVAVDRRDQCYARLSDDERERAARFRFDRDRNRFVVCRGNLRELLGERLGVAPADVEFGYGANGKPETRGVEFNVSHSDSRALIAISRARVVGVDLERMNRAFMHEQIPERFFSPGEVRALRALPEAEQVEAFFHCWTRKEAYVKARGVGLSLALDSFDVSLAPGEPARFLRGVEGWEIESVNAGEGYAAAVVASHSDS